MSLRYLLDTDICIYMRRKQSGKIAARFERLEPGDVAISVITYGELAYGAAKSIDSERAIEALERFVALVPALPLPEGAGRAFGQLRAVLAVKGAAIGPNDMWIAAHALASDLILVTNNEHEFSRVIGLKVENWAK